MVEDDQVSDGEQMARIAVFGIGNVLIGDDAAGPSVIHHLESNYEFPDDVFVADLGTPSLDLAARMSGYEVVIFVDAVSAKGSPGELRSYTRDDIVKHPPSLRISQHDPSLRETVLLVDLLPDGPRVIRLIGIIPASLEQFGLSAEVRAAVPAAAELVIEELRAAGVPVVPRAVRQAITAFWNKDASALPA
jgi:hydrogenase maturation protease